MEHSPIIEKSLAQCVRDLPEIYQPIFMHPEFSAHASRLCEDRLVSIIEIYRGMETRLGRPLRVLDLGCAQGYFSFHLAQMGASVTGIDFQSVNIDVCNALAAEHNVGDIRFIVGRIEATIAILSDDQYDLVLGLSVFHHLVHQFGIVPVQDMLLGVLSRKIAVGVFEMALKTEPPSWAASQPANPRDLLRDYAFVHELTRTRTHLSAIQRPLYAASNSYWCLNGKVEPFSSWSAESHALARHAAGDTRRYFFGRDIMAKIYVLDTSDKLVRDANIREHGNEVSFLSDASVGFPIPKLVDHGKHDKEAWLTRELWPGRLLTDIMHAKESYDPKGVLLDVLDQLAALETAGFYHSDIRTWNILVERDGRARLIDYGAISYKAEDCAWPGNLFLSFMIFAREVLSGTSHAPNPLRPPSFNPEGFPLPYNKIFYKLFEIDPKNWTFNYLNDLFIRALKENENFSVSVLPGFAFALRATEEAYLKAKYPLP